MRHHWQPGRGQQTDCEDFHVPEPVRHRNQDPPALGNRGIESYYKLQDDERNVTLTYDDQGPPGLKTFWWRC